MPRIGFTEVDVYAFLDSDSPEAKRFRTYLGYVCALDELVRDMFGDVNYADIYKHMEPDLRRMSGKRYKGPEEDIRSLLINSWLTELHLHIVDKADPGIVRIANHMAPMYSYYSTTRSASAWLYVQTGSAPTTHAAVLKQLSQFIEGRPGRFPMPWNLRCSEVINAVDYLGFSTPPGNCSNLGTSNDPEAVIAMALRTTRRRQVEKRVDEVKRQQKLSRAKNGEAARQDAALAPTNIFDFLWRIRTRSNYGDPAMYFEGALLQANVLDYHAALRRITASTNFLFEASLVQRAPNLVMDAATKFISRDRSELTDHVLLPRLQALGCVPEPKFGHRIATGAIT